MMINLGLIVGAGAAVWMAADLGAQSRPGGIPAPEFPTELSVSSSGISLDRDFGKRAMFGPSRGFGHRLAEVPALAWIQQFGTVAIDEARGIAAGAGGVYVAGFSWLAHGADIPVLPPPA